MRQGQKSIRHHGNELSCLFTLETREYLNETKSRGWNTNPCSKSPTASVTKFFLRLDFCS
jgi:hypothetical protein